MHKILVASTLMWNLNMDNISILRCMPDTSDWTWYNWFAVVFIVIIFAPIILFCCVSISQLLHKYYNFFRISTFKRQVKLVLFYIYLNRSYSLHLYRMSGSFSQQLLITDAHYFIHFVGCNFGSVAFLLTNFVYFTTLLHDRNICLCSILFVFFMWSIHFIVQCCKIL